MLLLLRFSAKRNATYNLWLAWLWHLHISISKRIFRESLLALWSVGLTYRDVSIYYRNVIYKLQQQLHSLCVCLSVCECVLCLMRFQQKTLWTRAKLFICRNCWECVCEWVCVYGSVCWCVRVSVVVQVILSAALSLSLSLLQVSGTN